MSRFVFFSAALLAPGIVLGAPEVKLHWMPAGAEDKSGFTNPKSVQLYPERPDFISKVPDGVSSPLFGLFIFGPETAKKQYAVLLDESVPDTARIWVDANGNGDFTDDPPVAWSPSKTNTDSNSVRKFAGEVLLSSPYASGDRPLGIKLYRFDQTDPGVKAQLSTLKEGSPGRLKVERSLYFYADYAWEGELQVADKSYKMMLVDHAAKGDFSDENLRLFLDANRDGFFDANYEELIANEPFNAGGVTYELSELTAEGTAIKALESSRSVAERLAPKQLSHGDICQGFEGKETEGKTVHFPEDYHGKIVLLDFWGSWKRSSFEDLPELRKIYTSKHGKGFDVLGINVDLGEVRAEALESPLVKESPWRQISDGNALSGPIPFLLNVQRIPARWLIDANTGKVLATGDELRGTALRKTIEHHLPQHSAK